MEAQKLNNLTIEEYILIDQEKKSIEIFSRRGDLWKITKFTLDDNKVPISSL